VEKITSSEVSGLLGYPPRVNEFTSHYLQEAISRGRLIHSRLGFDNVKTFQRVLRLNKESVLVVGMPDRVDDKYCYELKTYTRRTKEKVIKVGKIQCKTYTFITGLPSKLVLYSVDAEKITEEKIVPFNLKEFRMLIRKALLLREMIKKFKARFKDVQAEVKV